jgi:hypothetical protein
LSRFLDFHQNWPPSEAKINRFFLVKVSKKLCILQIQSHYTCFAENQLIISNFNEDKMIENWVNSGATNIAAKSRVLARQTFGR